MRYINAIVAFVALAILAVAPADADRRYRATGPPFTPGWAAPQLVVIPEGGPPGTVVQISGAKFHKYVEVFYGDVPMQILERSDRHIVAVIPRRIGFSDYIYVVDNTGRARTDIPFYLDRRR